MSELNHFAISAILHSEIVGHGNFGHGQIASLGDGQRYFDMLAINEPASVRKQDEKSELIKVVKAFLAVRKDRETSDLYIADPDRNSLFLAKCRALGASGSDYALNKTLLRARKSNHLRGLNSARMSMNCDRQAFAAEFAATELRYRLGASIDDILCDPALAAQFDSIAHRVTPGFSSFEYRWAILSIRKAGRRQVVPASFKMPKFGGRFKLVLDPLENVPDASGVYLLYEKQKLLYARSAEHLRQGIEVHRDPNALGAIAEKLWKPNPENFIVDYAVIKDKKSIRTVEKRVVEENQPVFNVPRSAA